MRFKQSMLAFFLFVVCFVLLILNKKKWLEERKKPEVWSFSVKNSSASFHLKLLNYN